MSRKLYFLAVAFAAYGHAQASVDQQGFEEYSVEWWGVIALVAVIGLALYGLFRLARWYVKLAFNRN